MKSGDLISRSTPLNAITLRRQARANGAQFRELVDHDAFGDTRVELLDGRIVRRVTRHAPHNFAVAALRQFLDELVRPRGYLVHEEKPVELGKLWRPEPDLAVTMGPLQRFRRVDPVASDLLLVIEVAAASIRQDRRLKLWGYASAGIPGYWVVDLNGARVFVHREPEGSGETAVYRRIGEHAAGQPIPVRLDGVDLGSIEPADFLP